MAKASDLQEGLVFSLGNPLLDISANVTDDFLKKYDLPKNGAILATKKHENLYEDLINVFEIDYNPGGASQNTCRFIQWILGKNNTGIASFLGCIGNDYFGKMMEKKAKSDGVKILYVTDEAGTATGTCAVLITDKGENRSLCAYLGAAEKLTKEHLVRNWYWVEKAKIFYLAGHSISVTRDSIIALAKQTLADKFNEKLLMFNLAAPYVSEKHIDVLNEILPNIDYLFGNDQEYLAFAKAKGYKTTDLKEIAKLAASEKKVKGVRFVIITQGPKPVLVAKTGDQKVSEYQVPQIDPKKIIDTNGAGDAFTGGFIAYMVMKKSFDDCIKCAIYCASECIQRLGCTFPPAGPKLP